MFITQLCTDAFSTLAKNPYGRIGQELGGVVATGAASLGSARQRPLTAIVGSLASIVIFNRYYGQGEQNLVDNERVGAGTTLKLCALAAAGLSAGLSKLLGGRGNAISQIASEGLAQLATVIAGASFGGAVFTASKL